MDRLPPPIEGIVVAEGVNDEETWQLVRGRVEAFGTMIVYLIDVAESNARAYPL